VLKKYKNLEMKITQILFILISCLWLNKGVSQISEKECKTTFTNIRGEYQGKNLFFQVEKEHIKKISLNKKEIKLQLTSELFELNLSDLEINQMFEVKIEYCENIPIPYKILNPEVKN
jgi:hypothetical protein